jgi:arylsulfatase A-like enzyme
MGSPEDRYDLTRRDLIAAGAGGMVLLGAGGCGFGGDDGGSAQAQVPDRPNVILVVIDSLRTDHVGAYGGRHADTPNLDEFARQSLRFTNARPESMATIPARRAMMTGRRVYPFRGWRPHPKLSGGPGFDTIGPKQITVPKVANRGGHLTAYVTDNPHILSPAYRRFRGTFDHAAAIRGQVPFYTGGRPKRLIGDRELMRYWPRELHGQPGAGRLRDYISYHRNRKSELDYQPARVFGAGMSFLDAAAQRQPFTLVVDSFDVHEPWDPPPAYLRRYAKGARGPQPIQPFNTPSGLTEDLRRRTLRRAQALYAGEVSFVDAMFGRLMEKVDQLGLAGTTWVIVISDHGVMLGERGIIGKSFSNLHRELTHVPLMIRHPAGLKAGTTTPYRGSTHDIGPTMLSAAGLEIPRKMNGEDLTKLFEGKTLKKRDYFTSCMKNYVVAGDDRWLLICDNQGGEARLYDKRKDPRETRNVASRHPRQVRRLWRKVVADAGNKPLPTFERFL